MSVLIPARDEERNIERCVRSLMAQADEVIVLDDESTDRTARIVESMNARLIRGVPLPAGWRGKNWACHQLSQLATGDWLLFTDADTVHSEDSVAAAVAYAEEQRADLLSLMPRQLCVTPMERLVVPLMNFFFVTFFPAFMLERSRDPKFHAANGQFLLFRREAYERIGGHESIRESVVDDLALARRIREEQLRLVIADGDELVQCRMYETARGVVDGFTKNLYAALGGSPMRAFGVALLLLALFVVPPIALVLTRKLSWLVPTILGVALRLRTDPRPRALLHPLSIATAVLLLFRSMLRGSRVSWKGRPLQPAA